MSTEDSILIRRSLEELIRSVDLELARIEVKLMDAAKRFCLNSWEELEEFFKRGGMDNPEVDLAWTEYQYLKNRRETLLKDREKAIRLLSRG